MNTAMIVRTDAAETDSVRSLLKELASILGRTANDYRRMAEIVRELEEHGYDVSSIRLGFVDNLRRIAAGQLLPEILVVYSGARARTALEFVGRLTIQDQRKLVDGEPLEIAAWRDGRIERRRVDPMDLSAAQLRLLFGNGQIRRIEHQIALLESRRPERAASSSANAEPRNARIRVDKERGGLHVKSGFITVRELMDAISEIREPDDGAEAPSERTVSVKLTESQHERLRVAAAKWDASAADLIRRALRAYGLI